MLLAAAPRRQLQQTGDCEQIAQAAANMAMSKQGSKP